MAPMFEFWALLLVSVYNAWQLAQLRRLARGCYVELSTARWERGKLLRAEEQLQGLAPFRGQADDSPK